MENSVGYCIDIHDLVISKLVASREKDLDFVKEILKNDMVVVETLLDLINNLPASVEDSCRIGRVKNTLRRILRAIDPTEEFHKNLFNQPK